MNPVNAVIPLPALLPCLLRHTEGRSIRQTGEIQLGSRHNRPCAVDVVIEAEAGAIQYGGIHYPRPRTLKSLEVVACILPFGRGTDGGAGQEARRACRVLALDRVMKA